MSVYQSGVYSAGTYSDGSGTAYTLVCETGVYTLTGHDAALNLTAPTLSRPQSDISVVGWTSTAPTLAEAIDEPIASDADYITSPSLSGSPAPASFVLTLPVNPGTSTHRIRARRTAATGELRLVLMSDVADVGASDWQAVTASFATYSLAVNASSTATRARIEVRA